MRPRKQTEKPTTRKSSESSERGSRFKKSDAPKGRPAKRKSDDDSSEKSFSRPKRSFSKESSKPSFGERKSFDKPKRSYKKDNDRFDNSEGGERKRYSRNSDSDRPKRFDDRKSSSFDKPKRSYKKDNDRFEGSEGGERKRFSRTSDSDRPKRFDDRKSSGFDKPKRSYKKDNDRFDDSEGGERKRFSRSSDSDRPKRFDDRKSSGFDKPKRSYKKDNDRFDDSEGGERKRYSRNSDSDRTKRFDDRKSSSFDKPKRSYKKDNDRFDDSEGGERKRFSRNSDSDRPKRFDDRKNSSFDKRRKYNDSDKNRFENAESGERTGKRPRLSDREKTRRFDERKASDRPRRHSNESDEKNYSSGKRRKPSDSEDNEIRLNKYISNAGICSRREADLLIESGVVSVNGEVVTEMGYKVKPTDIVHYGDQRLSPEKKRYVLLNKPKGFITTVDDPFERKTVMGLVANACKERIYPVGRLDRNTTGLLLFTNDGDLAKRLTHPSNGARKVYHVELDQALTKRDMDTIENGLTLDDGFIKVDAILYDGDGSDKKKIGIELHSGKNRIVRRVFESLGYEVLKLDRVIFASLTKKDLKRGDWRFLTEKEISFLHMA